MLTVEERIKKAQSGGAEDLWAAVRDPHPDVLQNAVYNRNFSEDMAVFLAKRTNVPSEVLTMLSTDRRFKSSYKLKLFISRNPKTPQRVVFSLLKFLRIFDLADITRDNRIHISIRQKVELIITEKLRAMPLGIKMALARRADSNILLVLMEYGDEQVVRICLDSSSITEEHICRIINMTATPASVIRQISADEKWTLRYHVRYALIRNVHSPLARIVKFLPGMKTVDLRDLLEDPKLPSSSRPFIFRELSERAEGGPTDLDEVYHLSDDDDRHLDDASEA